MYSKEAQQLIKEGYTTDAINAYIQEEYGQLQSEGYNADVIKQYQTERWGLSKPLGEAKIAANADTDKKLKAAINKSIDEGALQGKDPSTWTSDELMGARKAATPWEAMLAGYEVSTTGLMQREKLPSIALDKDATLMYKLMSMVGQSIGDIPTAIAGGAAGLPGGPVTTAAGAFALPEAVRKVLMDKYLDGEIDSGEEFMTRLFGATAAAGQGYITGAATFTAGAVAAPFGAVAKGAAEVGTMATTGALVHGEIPTLDDFALAAIPTAATRATSFYLGKYKQMYGDLDVAPRKLVDMSKFQPTIVEDLRSVNRLIPRALKSQLSFWKDVKNKTTEAIRAEAEKGKKIQEAKDAEAATKAAKEGIQKAMTPREKILAKEAEAKKEYFESVPAPTEEAAAAGGGVEAKPSTYQKIKSKITGEELDTRSVEQKWMEDDGPPPAFETTDEAIAALNRKQAKHTVSMGQHLSDLYTHVFDSLAPLNKAAKKGEMTKGYEAARLLAGAPGRALHFLLHGTFKRAEDGTFPITGEALRDILRPLKDEQSIKDFSTFLSAHQVKALQREKVYVGDKAAGARLTLQDKRFTQYEPIRKKIEAYNKRLIDYALDSGLLDERTYDRALVEANMLYPLDNIIKPVSTVRVQKLLGVKAGINPLETIVANTHKIVHQAEKNRVRQLVAKEYGKEVLLQSRVDPAVSTPIEVYVNGERKLFSVDKDIARSVMRLDEAGVKLFAALTAPAKWLRAGTAVNPAQMSFNVIRDQTQAGLYSKYGYIIGYDMLRGMAVGLSGLTSKKTGKAIFPKLGDMYWEWVRAGGADAAMVSIDKNMLGDALKQLYSMPVRNKIKAKTELPYLADRLNPINWPRTAWDTVSKTVGTDGPLIRALREAAELGDSATRLGEYRRAREAGVTPERAAIAAREVTQDFAKVGASMRAMNSLTAFFTTTLGGLDRFRQFASDNPKAAMAKTMAGIVMPTMLLNLIRQDIIANEPESDMAQALLEVPDWERFTFWHVPTPNGELTRIPKPFELGQVFATPVEMFMDYAFKNNPHQAKTFMQEMWESGYFGALGDSFIPGLIPTIGQAPAEIAAGYSFFADRPLIPAYQEKFLPELQSSMHSSELSMWLSHQINQVDVLSEVPWAQKFTSPIAIDHLIKSWTGGAGRAVLQTLDKLWEDQGWSAIKNKPDMTAGGPLHQAFISMYPRAGAKSIDMFRRKSTLPEKRLATYTEQLKRGQISAAEFEQKLQQGNIGKFSSIKASLSSMSAAVNMIYYSPQMEKDEKLQMINTLYKQMIVVAREGLNVIDAMEKK